MIILSDMEQRNYALARTRREGWKSNLNSKPTGAKVHPNKKYEYDTYNIVWVDDNGKMITRFVLDDYSDDAQFKRDMGIISIDDKKRLMIAIDQIKAGFVFNDDDKFIRKNYFNKSNKLLYQWDTGTHCLTKRFPSKDYIVYSKHLGPESDKGNRLTYVVYRPEKDEDGNWFCRVRLSRCYKHYLGDTRYDEADDKNTISDSINDKSLSDLIKLKELLPDEFIRRFSEVYNMKKGLLW